VEVQVGDQQVRMAAFDWLAAQARSHGDAETQAYRLAGISGTGRCDSGTWYLSQPAELRTFEHSACRLGSTHRAFENMRLRRWLVMDRMRGFAGSR
jgi:hypothetical protein